MFKFFKEKLQGFFSKKPEEEKIEKVDEKEKKKAGKIKEIKPEKIKVKKEETEKKPKGFVIPKETEETEILSEESPIEQKQKEIPSQKDFLPQIQKQELKKYAKKEQKPDISQENKEEVEYIIEQAEEKAEEIKEPEIEGHEGFFSRFKKKFVTTKLDQEKFNEFFENLEMLLLENNVALAVVDKIREDMEKKLVNIEVKKDQLEDEIKNSLRESILEILIPPFNLIDKIKKKENEPFVILFFGINGSGKTTTIAKMANMLAENNLSSVFAAADTFRAASIEQLMKHGEKLRVKVIHQTYGSDPAAVAYDAISYAKAHQIKVVLIDTAGRMHTKSDLMREMEKIIRVTKPDLKIFVAESITGNDATEQAKIFNETANIDGTILTKADVDEKGGTAISIGYVTGKPILFLGTGQEYSDLHKFSPEEVIVNLGLD